VGYNHRLDTLQAAVLRVKLRYLDAWNATRREHAALYNRLLSGAGVVTPVPASFAEPVWHLYVLRVADRAGLQKALADHGITAGIHYPRPIHMQLAYRSLDYQHGDFPVTEEYADQILSLPMFAELTPDQIAYVAETIREAVAAQQLELLGAPVVIR
jgi:dTDP-4-amino-4,6-dideoxygalactose transaminase